MENIVGFRPFFSPVEAVQLLPAEAVQQLREEALEVLLSEIEGTLDNVRGKFVQSA